MLPFDLMLPPRFNILLGAAFNAFLSNPSPFFDGNHSSKFTSPKYILGQVSPFVQHCPFVLASRSVPLASRWPHGAVVGSPSVRIPSGVLRWPRTTALPALIRCRQQTVIAMAPRMDREVQQSQPV
ncbi:hypothetical protein EJB05_10716, partial [Eragrostis curvula]